jgi:hypothetical protein
MSRSKVVLLIGDREYTVEDLDDGTYRVTDPDGTERVGKFCTAHTEQEHLQMIEAGVFC